MSTMIEFRNVKKTYGDKVVLKDFNLQVEKGDFVTIIGSSGCGKTTALKMVNGLLTPDSGEILIHGEKIREKIRPSCAATSATPFRAASCFPT